MPFRKGLSSGSESAWRWVARFPSSSGRLPCGSSPRNQELLLPGESQVGQAGKGRMSCAHCRHSGSHVESIGGPLGSRPESLRAALMISLGAITGGTGWGQALSVSSSTSSSACWVAPMGTDCQRGRGATSSQPSRLCPAAAGVSSLLGDVGTSHW